MSRKRFKWNRKRYYSAKHQCRLLARLHGYGYSPPDLVERYIKLMDSIDVLDPLTRPIDWRYDRCDVPF